MHIAQTPGLMMMMICLVLHIILSGNRILMKRIKISIDGQGDSSYAIYPNMFV